MEQIESTREPGLGKVVLLKTGLEWLLALWTIPELIFKGYKTKFYWRFYSSQEVREREETNPLYLALVLDVYYV